MSHFALCVIHDNGSQELLCEDDYPLFRRLKLGPSEDIAKVFIVEATKAKEVQLPEEVMSRDSHVPVTLVASVSIAELVTCDLSVLYCTVVIVGV